MKLRLLPCILPILVLFVSAVAVQAGVILTPPGVNPGDRFRVVFVLRGTTAATSANALDYDNVITTAANIAGLTYGGFPVSWQAIVSTATTNANDASRLPTSSAARIFRIDGVKIANNGADLWDGSILAPIQIDETGALLTSRQVFTGTNSNGAAVSGLTLGNVSGNTVVGDTDFADSQWINRRNQLTTAQHRLYGISQELVATIPEPSGLSLCGWMMLSSLFRRYRGNP